MHPADKIQELYIHKFLIKHNHKIWITKNNILHEESKGADDTYGNLVRRRFCFLSFKYLLVKLLQKENDFISSVPFPPHARYLAPPCSL